MSNLFIVVYNFFHKRRALLLLLFIAMLAFFIYTASKIKLEENAIRMLPGEAESAQLNTFLENSKFSDRIMVVISDKDTSGEPNPSFLTNAASTFVESVNSQLGQYIDSVNYRASENSFTELMNVIETHLPVFLNENDYLTIDSIISQEGIKNKVESNYRSLISPSGIGLKPFITSDPLGINFLVLKKLDAFKGDEPIQLYDQFFVSENGHHVFIFIDPKYGSGETDKNIEFFRLLDEIISEQKIIHTNTDVHYFGAPAVAAGNSKQIRADTQLTLSITVLLLIIIFYLFFRKLLSPVLILIPVVFGALFSLTIIYFLKGSISVISLGAGSLVLGIAVNYSLHFLTHNKYHPGIKNSLRELSFPMIAGSLTTIGGFLCLQFIDAPVLRDLGLFAALSLAGAAIATLVFLPHFVTESKSESNNLHSAPVSLFNKIINAVHGNKKLALLFVLITPVFFYFARDVQFETDMYKINYMSDDLRKSETFVNQFGSYYQKSIFTVASANSLDEALLKNETNLNLLEKLKSEGKIISFTNPSTLLPSHKVQLERINKWDQYWSTSKREEVYNNLKTAGAQFKFKESAFSGFIDISQKSFEPLTVQNKEILKTTLLNNFIEQNGEGISVIGLVKTTPEHSAEISRSITENNPEMFVFDRQGITDRLVGMVSADFNFITIWTSLLVFIALLIIYGRIELAIISFLPMVMSWIFILGMMSMFDIKFNIINIVLSTLIFALGDDFCIFTTDGLQQQYARKAETLRSTTASISLSALTTIIGMGVLIFAQHPALNSIALVSIIGIFSVWLMSQVIQPVLFNFLIVRPTIQQHEPYTFFNILKSIFAFSYFLFGSLLISVIGFIMFKIIPGKSPGKKYLYHVILSKFAWSMIFIMTNVKKTIFNELREDFSKPAVIIANHSSFLDILLMIMLHPKLILLTNKWVYNSPVFGLAVRLAEYYPVAEGAENTIDKLEGKVAEGYSIVVFPEGTRSVDGKIARFHKGAFYLSEKLNIDILPILIHGAHYTMTKGFFFLKNGHLTLKFLPRIKPDDTRFGNSYSEKAKLTGRYFREQHRILSEQLETTDYFKNQLFSNFIFKGPVLEWYMRIKVRLENNYSLFNDLIPRKGNIVDIGCGYGFLSYILGYTSHQRIILGIDYDEDKIEIARNGYLKGSNVQFTHANALEFNFSPTDVFVLNDVLHYLETPAQRLLLKKCISNLTETGTIILRDGISELSARHKGTKLTELFSTKILGFNKTSKTGLNFISSSMIHEIANEAALDISTIDNTRYTSNVIFVLKKRS